MNRSTVFLVVLLIVLAVVAYFLLPSGEERQTSYTPAEIKLSVDSVSVVKIDIQRPGKSVTLENLGGKWMLSSPVSYPADNAAIKQVIAGIRKFRVGSLVSSNVEKQSVFQVDTSGTKLTLTERGGKATSLIIGKTGPSYSEVYFRLPGSKDVYLGEGLEPWTVNKDIKDWRDRVIMSSPSELIKELTYSDGAKEYRLHRDSTGWKSEDRPIDANTMNPLLNSLANLRADDFVDTMVRSAGRPVKLKVRGNEDIDLSLSPYGPDSSKYIVQTSKSAQTYQISKWVAQQLLKPLSESGQSKRAVASLEKKEEQEAPPPAPVVAKQPEKKPVPVISTPPKKEVAKAPTRTETTRKVAESKLPLSVPPPVKKETTPPVSSKIEKTPVQTPAQKTTTRETAPAQPPAPKTTATETRPAAKSPLSAQPSTSPSTEDEGDLTVHTVKRGETMQSIANRYGVAVEQILKWNLLKSIAVKPGQELYIFVKAPVKK